MASFGEEGKLHQRKFAKEEVREVQDRHILIYGIQERIPRSGDVRQAWEEVAAIMNATSSTGTVRTVSQCRKRFNDVRRRTKALAAASRREMNAT